MCHNTLGDTISGNYMKKNLRFDSGAPEEWIKIYFGNLKYIFIPKLTLFIRKKPRNP